MVRSVLQAYLATNEDEEGIEVLVDRFERPCKGNACMVGCSGKVSRNHRVLDHLYPVFFSDLNPIVVNLGVLGNPKGFQG